MAVPPRIPAPKAIHCLKKDTPTSHAFLTKALWAVVVVTAWVGPGPALLARGGSVAVHCDAVAVLRERIRGTSTSVVSRGCHKVPFGPMPLTCSMGCTVSVAIVGPL